LAHRPRWKSEPAHSLPTAPPLTLAPSSPRSTFPPTPSLPPLKTDGTTCVAQGSVTATGGGGDLTVDNVVFAAAQAFTITAFTLNAGNA
jgi:hypothetical protein